LLGEPETKQRHRRPIPSAQTLVGPNEEAPVSLFNHILFDGYVVVTYKPELPQSDVDALEDWILERDIIVAARPETDQEEMVVASTVRRELACSQLDIGALTTFREEWFGHARPSKTGGERKRHRRRSAHLGGQPN
jgi:Protein of unknown function (DUF3105)